MSLEIGRRILFERYEAASGVPFLPVALEAPDGWARAHTSDPHGRSIYLLGKTFASRDDAGKTAVQWVLEQIQQGLAPEFVPVIALPPVASAAFMAIVDDGPVDDFLVHGARWGGK